MRYDSVVHHLSAPRDTATSVSVARRRPMTCRPATIVVLLAFTSPVAAAVGEMLTQTTGVAAAAANEGDDVDWLMASVCV